MFKRTKKKKVLSQIKDVFWPKIGFKRSASYIGHRISRLNASSYSISAGFACGAAASFTPFIGLHFVIAAFLAFLFRASIFASAFGTIIGNPWTFPLIYYSTYNLGIMFDKNANHEGFQSILDESLLIYKKIIDNIDFFENKTSYNFKIFLDGVANFMHILEPLIIGGVILGSIVWIFFFMFLYKKINAYKMNVLIKRVQRKTKMKK